MLRRMATALLALMTFFVCTMATAADFTGHKVGVVYFTLLHNRLFEAGDPYQDREFGEAEYLARAVAYQTGGELIEINTVDKYPADYDTIVAQAREEQRKNYHPPLVSTPDLSSYDVLFIGFPNWWSSYPMAFATLFESQSFEGKAIIPFCTHAGSRLGRVIPDMKKALPGATVYDGFEMRGRGMTQTAADAKVSEFLDDFEF